MNEDQTPLWQQMIMGFVNHQTRAGIVKALDFLADLSEDDCAEMTRGLSPENAARFYAVVRAAKPPR